MVQVLIRLIRHATYAKLIDGDWTRGSRPGAWTQGNTVAKGRNFSRFQGYFLVGSQDGIYSEHIRGGDGFLPPPE